MEQNELNKIVKNHLHWLSKDCENYECMFANLSGADLRRANLSGANLSGANLYKADLSEADLSGADLSGANLYKADLSEADLSGADLSGADLRRADLRRADLSGADLYKADLSKVNLSRADLYKADLYKANLSEANLSEANLSRAHLSGADLSGADLYKANLSGANLSGIIIYEASMNKFFPICCPEYGAFIGWKKADSKIIKLQITEDAKRLSSFGRKCRCSKAKVLGIYELDGSTTDINEISSDHDEQFIYRIGETVEVKNFDCNRMYECAPGIHFFITRQEAVDY